MTLEGKTALVTGATSGIGRAAAILLAQEGATVIVHGRDPERGAATVAEIEGAGGHARFIAADLGDITEVRRLADEVGEVDVLINNAGFAWFGPSADLDVDTYDSLWDSNVRSAYFLTAALAPKMVANGGGSIVSIASMVGQIGMKGGAAYGATKLALIGLSRAWAAEYTPTVRVNVVAPGPVYTASPAERTSALGDTTPMGRAASTDEIAEAIVFLASPKSSYTTGATLNVDGGYTAV
jgi:NAD(P)-dependent dehydrogenase (short-subunit alcohol dehydrogenase family)